MPQNIETRIEISLTEAYYGCKRNIRVGSKNFNIDIPKVVAASGMAGFYSNNLIESKKINGRFYICGDFVNEARVGEGLMAPRVGIVANHEANMVVRLLLNEEEV